MSLLTDTDIRKILCEDVAWPNKKQLHIHPFKESCLTPVGYDLRVGSQYASSINADMCSLDPGQRFDVCPGDTVLITTLEDVGMPEDRTISALITSKVSKVSLGLSHISTNIDPDWKGKLLIAIHNPSRNVVSLGYGEAFCTINFIQNLSPSTKDCGKEPGRTDILIKQFVINSKANKKLVQKHARRLTLVNYALKFTSIIVLGATGYYFWGPTPGFAAMAAIGVGVAANINIGRK